MLLLCLFALIFLGPQAKNCSEVKLLNLANEWIQRGVALTSKPRDHKVSKNKLKHLHGKVVRNYGANY